MCFIFYRSFVIVPSHQIQIFQSKKNYSLIQTISTMLRTRRGSEQMGRILVSRQKTWAPVLAISFPNQVTL